VRNSYYIEDTVEGFIKIAESHKSVGEVINIGSGEEISIGDLADKIVSLTGRNVEIVFDETRIRPEKSEVNRLLADNSKAKELLQWEPMVSMDEGLRKTIEWISEHINVYKVDIYNV